MVDIKNLLNTNNWFNYQNYYENITDKNFSIFVEVGVWKGHSISYLASRLKEKDKINNCKIYAVDLFEDTVCPVITTDEKTKNEIQYINTIYNEYLKAKDVREYIVDIKSYSWEAAKFFEDESIDFCFIDADHSYESVKKDILFWYPKVKKNGIIAGHDYSNLHPGVIKATDELIKDKIIYENTVWEHIKL